MSKQRYRRHLPHQVPENTPIFLTWNLKGALPKDRLIELQRQDELDKAKPFEKYSRQDRELILAKRKFARRDDYLDASSTGPKDLDIPAIANLVEEAILVGASERYELYAWCVMANHVHVLLKPNLSLAQITQRLKGGTARQISNRKAASFGKMNRTTTGVAMKKSFSASSRISRIIQLKLGYAPCRKNGAGPPRAIVLFGRAGKRGFPHRRSGFSLTVNGALSG